MGIFVKDNISGINIGSKSSDVSGKTVQSSNIDISNIERGNSDFTSESNISSSVDFGDLFDDKASGSEVSSSSMTNGKTNVDGTNQSGTSATQQGMTNDKVNQENSNQQTGNAQSASLSNGKNNENNTSQSTGTAQSQGTTSSGNQGGSTGQTGGSANGASTSSGKGPSGSTGGSTGKASGNSMSGGNPSGGQGSHGGSKAGGVEVKSTTVQNATRPTALNNSSSMKNTGTTVSQRTVNASHVETNASKAESNTGGILGKAVRWFVKEVIHVIEVVESTKVVIATSVLSAVGNIVEAVVIDGLVGYVVAGVLDLCGADDVANDLRKFAARDQVGEINKWFYEETDIGKRINELSAIKYDSAIAKGITTFTETAVKIAAATAIAALPGGIFILAGIGALEGMGNAAESAYQNALANGETDLTLSVLSNLGILGSGALDAVAWIFNAKLGQGLLNIAGDIGELGIKEAGTTMLKQIFSKETLSNALKPSNLLMNLGQSGLQSGGKIGPIFSKIVNGEEISVGEWGDLALTFGLYFLINTLEDSAREYVSGYEAGGNQSFGQRNVTGGEETKKPEASEPEEVQYKEKEINLQEQAAKEAEKEFAEEKYFKKATSEDLGAKEPDAVETESSYFKKATSEDLVSKQPEASEVQLKENLVDEKPKDVEVELTPAEKIAKEQFEFEDRVKNQLANLDKSDPNYAFKEKLLLENAEMESRIMDVAHQKGMTVEQYIKSFKSSDVLTPEQQREVAEATAEVYKKAVDAEKEITATMHLLEDDNVKLEGLDYVLKSEKSISDKLSRMVAEGEPISFAKRSINDTVRYTLIIDEAEYTDGVLSRLKTLTDNNYEIIDMNNAWGGSKYQGLNVTLKAPNGVFTELQFHTPDSFNVKQNQNHLFYELARTKGVPPELKELSNRIMANNQTLGVKDTQFRHYMSDIQDVLSKSKGLDSFYIKKFDILKANAIDVAQKGNYSNTIVALTKYFGDGGFEISERLKSGETIEDIRKTLTGSDLAEFEKFLTTRAGQYLKELTPDELKAVTIYTGGKFDTINTILRRGLENKTDEIIGGKPFLEYMKDLDSAMQKGAIDETMMLYRGVAPDTFWFQDFKDLLAGVKQNDYQTIAQVLNDSCIGKAITDRGYISTSPGYDCSFDFKPVSFEIVAPTGTKGGYINQISQYYNSENELLLARGTDLIITGASYEEVIPNSGIFKLVVRLIAQN